MLKKIRDKNHVEVSRRKSETKNVTKNSLDICGPETTVVDDVARPTLVGSRRNYEFARSRRRIENDLGSVGLFFDPVGDYLPGFISFVTLQPLKPMFVNPVQVKCDFGLR